MIKVDGKFYKILKILKIGERGIWFEDMEFDECFVLSSEIESLPFHPVWFY